MNRSVRSLALKKPVIVEAEGECVMHDDITHNACKEQAVLRAKQSAIETGGMSLVRSLTEVSMNDIVKDEISVKTLAKIRHMDMLQSPRLVAQGELGKYVARIRAVVQSQPPETQAAVREPVSEAQTTAPSPMPEPEAVENTVPLIHTVKPGETLFRISRRYGVDIDRLKQWNHMQDDFVEVGQRLIVWKSEPKDSRKPEGPTITPASAFNVAYNDYLNGKYDLAVEGFQRFVNNFPATLLTPHAQYWLGESHYNLKDYGRAIQTFDYLVTEYPGNEKVPASLYKLGLATAETGDLVKSRKSLRRVLKEFPLSDEAKLAKNKLAEIR